MAQTKKSKKSEEFNIDKFVQSLSIQLKTLNVTSNDITGEKVEMKKVAFYEISELVDKELVIDTKMEISFEPSSPFTIIAEFRLIYRLQESISKTQISKNIDDILSPCGNTFSLITGFLSEKLLSIPMIISPNFSYTNVKSSSKE